MNVIEILKKFFKLNKNEKTKLLTDGCVHDKSQEKEEFKKSIFVGDVSITKQPSLQECVNEFIKQYNIQQKYEKSESGKVYHAYSRMFCGEEKIGDNFKNQMRLKKLVKKNNFRTDYQTSNDRMVFMHIAGEDGIDEFNEPDMEKIYINCERSYVSIITAAIFKQIKDIAGDKLQMKCVSEQFGDMGLDEEEKEVKNYQRNDKIVIYTENHEKTEEICNAISLLKRDNPKIFKGIKSIPILENQDGFMVVADKKYSDLHAKTPIGDASGRTFNDFVSDILYRSVIYAFDKELMIDSNDESYRLSEKMAEYSRIYPEMEEEQRRKILLDASDTFRCVCKEAGIKLNDNGQQQFEKNDNQR